MTVEPMSPMALMGVKLVGAVAGSAISVAYLLPTGRREAAVRFLTGAVTGIVFGGPSGLMLADHLGLTAMLSGLEIAMMGSAAASLCAWGALGVLTRFADQLFARPDRGKEGSR